MAAYTTIDDAGSYFNTVLYSGTGAEHAITGVGFSADFTWNKNRNNAENHNLWDTVRTAGEGLQSNTDIAEFTTAQGLKSWQSDGFTMGTNGSVNGATATCVAWNWKAGTTSGITTDGSTTITPSAYSFSAAAGFSILKYTGNGVAGGIIAHGLGVTPTFILIKRTDGSNDWAVYHQGMDATAPEDYYMKLNTNAARGDNNSFWNDTAPDSVNFTVGDSGDTNGSSSVYVAYCFTNIQGYSKFGAYVGNGDADGPMIFTGFQPGWVLIKKTSGTADYQLVDNKRLGYNSANYELYPNTPAVQGPGLYIDILSNGFKIIHTSSNVNTDGGDYVYAAFAQNPLVNSEGVPGTSRFSNA